MRLGYRLVTVSANHEKSLYLLSTLDLISLFCTIYLTCLKMYPSFSGAIWTVTESGLSILTKLSKDSFDPIDVCVLVLCWSKIACPVNVHFVNSNAAGHCKITHFVRHPLPHRYLLHSYQVEVREDLHARWFEVKLLGMSRFVFQTTEYPHTKSASVYIADRYICLSNLLALSSFFFQFRPTIITFIPLRKSYTHKESVKLAFRQQLSLANQV